jgi:hypothetical protein
VIVSVLITEADLLYATKEATEMGKLNNSITAGQGSIAGFVGEKLLANYMHGVISHTYDYDILL